MPTLQQHHRETNRGTYTDERHLAFCPVGIGPSWTLPYCYMAAQIPRRRDRLLHQMGQGKTIGHYYREKCPKFHLEEHHLPLWNPRVIVSNNGKQFDNDAFRDFCEQLGTKNHYSFLAHPQANGQVEVTNCSLLKMIKNRLEGEKGIWPNELPGVLWAYRTTVHTSTRETPFCLAYRHEAVISTEVRLTGHRVSHHDEGRNEEGMRLQ